MYKSITFILRYYPPSLNINGEAVCDMIEYLEDNYDIKCNVVQLDKENKHGGRQRNPRGNVYKIKNYLDYDNAICRFLKLFVDGYLLMRKARTIKDSLFAVTTSPPLLPFAASMYLRKDQSRVLWALDLFPESFMANKMISSNNPIYKFLIKKTYSVAPDYIIALGPMQAEALQELYRKKIHSFTLPCGAFTEPVSNDKPAWYDDNVITFGYCGNINDAHNADFVIQVAKHIKPALHKIILALYGNKADEVKSHVKDLPGVVLVDFVPRNQLPFIDIHLVTLRKEFTHLMVPSKAVSAVTMNRCILFCGDENSDNWYLLKEAGWFIPEDENMKTAVAEFMEKIDRESISAKEENAKGISKTLNNYLRETYEGIAAVLVKGKN